MRPERRIRHWKKDIRRFFKRFKNILLIAAAAAAVLLVVFVIVPVATGNTQKTTPTPEEPQDIYEGVDEETLAGLAGTDSSLFDTKESAQQELLIGVTLLSLREEDEVLLGGLEKAAAEDLAQGVIGELMVYDARGGPNQQIQDVYSMVNKGASVLVVANTQPYNFSRIAEIAKSNGIPVVAYNIEADSGFAVNVGSRQDASAEFAQFLKDAGMEQTDVLNATDEQVQAMQGIVEVDSNYDEMWDAVYEIKTSIENGEPKQSMAVFDYNSNDVFRTWLQSDITPKAFAGIATVRFIKTWYELLNGGVSVELEEAGTGGAEEDEEMEAPTKMVSATAGDIRCYAITSVENTGGVVYAFAKNLAEGKALPEENYVYTFSGAEAITDANLASYYEAVKEKDSGLVYSSVDIADINALFTQPEA
ncbi:hypothetical protein LJC56_03740 [Christensenellaceae bacterium OttesenSCG-928-K19]|nr:hypothetical protein [Christensenellaceae bacterium OttesenSCG-928-K19]